MDRAKDYHSKDQGIIKGNHSMDKDKHRAVTVAITMADMVWTSMATFITIQGDRNITTLLTCSKVVVESRDIMDSVVCVGGRAR